MRYLRKIPGMVDRDTGEQIYHDGYELFVFNNKDECETTRVPLVRRFLRS